MRRLLLIAATIALLVGASAGVASARFASDGTHSSAPARAPFRVPAAAPRPDAAQPGSYGFRSSERIAAALQRASTGAADAPAAAPAGGASASVVVTAVVLPVVFIIVDADGDVVRLVTNTPDRDGTSVMYTVRVGDEGGEAATLDAATWADARAALRSATAGTGTVWSN